MVTQKGFCGRKDAFFPTVYTSGKHIFRFFVSRQAAQPNSLISNATAGLLSGWPRSQGDRQYKFAAVPITIDPALTTTRKAAVALRGGAIVGALLVMNGCGVVWDGGGERHALGLGYVAWPLPPAQQPTVVQGVDVVGAALLATQNETGIVVGYNSERSVKLDVDQVVTLDCLKCDLAGAHPSAAKVK